MNDPKNWLDQNPSQDHRFADEELKQLKQKYQHTQDYQEQRKEIFHVFKIFFIMMFVIGYCILGYAITKPTSYSAIIAAISVMVPLVLTLAMLRMLYGNEKDKREKAVPSITFNVGKELKAVLLAYMKKNTD